MISCILWESHKLKSFSAWNQFKAARFVTNYGKSWFGTTQTSILDPIYVINAFGSMLSCILCEWQKFSESHKLKRFGARNQFRAAWFVTVSFIGSSLNAMELVVRN